MWGLCDFSCPSQDDEHGGVVQYDVPAGIQFNGALEIFPYPPILLRFFDVLCNRGIAEGGLGEGADVSTIAFSVGT